MPHTLENMAKRLLCTDNTPHNNKSRLIKILRKPSFFLDSFNNNPLPTHITWTYFYNKNVLLNSICMLFKWLKLAFFLKKKTHAETIDKKRKITRKKKNQNRPTYFDIYHSPLSSLLCSYDGILHNNTNCVFCRS